MRVSSILSSLMNLMQSARWIQAHNCPWRHEFSLIWDESCSWLAYCLQAYWIDIQVLTPDQFIFLQIWSLISWLLFLSHDFQTRGSTRDGTGVHDSIVNQLLTKVQLSAVLSVISLYFGQEGPVWQVLSDLSSSWPLHMIDLVSTSK